MALFSTREEETAIPHAATSPEAVVGRLQQALAGDGSADPALVQEVDALFAAHQGRVWGACRRLVSDPERARDLAQETLLVAWRRLPEFRGESKFSTWLIGIARNVCFKAIRKRGELLTADGVLEGEDAASDALRGLQRQEREDLIRDAAAAVLDAEEQEAVWLRYVEQMPQDVITDVLGLDASSGARGLLQRCRRKLERELRRRLETMGHGSSFARVTS